MMEAREEAGMVLFQVVGEALARTGLKPKDIDILVVNCSLFCPTPSLSAMLVNKFHFQSDVQTFNLGGMGCSASPIAVDLARRLLRSPEQRNTLALVVSTENITQNWYRGNDRSMLLSNCLFRCGAAAMLLSNKGRDARRARFKLLHIVRTHSNTAAHGRTHDAHDPNVEMWLRTASTIVPSHSDPVTLVSPVSSRFHSGAWQWARTTTVTSRSSSRRTTRASRASASPR